MLRGKHMYFDEMINPVEPKCGALPCPPYGDENFLFLCSEYYVDSSPGYFCTLIL